MIDSQYHLNPLKVSIFTVNIRSRILHTFCLFPWCKNFLSRVPCSTPKRSRTWVCLCIGQPTPKPTGLANHRPPPFRRGSTANQSPSTPSSGYRTSPWRPSPPAPCLSPCRRPTCQGPAIWTRKPEIGSQKLLESKL